MVLQSTVFPIVQTSITIENKTNFSTSQSGYRAIPKITKQVSSKLSISSITYSKSRLTGGEIAILMDDKVGASEASLETDSFTPLRANRSPDKTQIDCADINRDLGDKFDHCIMSEKPPPEKEQPETMPNLPGFPKLTGHNTQNSQDATGISNLEGTGLNQHNFGEPSGTLNLHESFQPNLADPKHASGPGQITDQTCLQPQGIGHNDGFTEVNKKKTTKHAATTLATTRKHTLGVQFNRTLSADARISSQDLGNLFRIISHIDSDAIILPSNKDISKAKHVDEMKKLLPMDLNGFLDIKNTAWGKPSDNKKRTTFSFWIASDVVSPGLRAFRDNGRFSEFLQAGACTMNSTNLKESRSKIVAYFSGKDPKHTHRDTMAARMLEHLATMNDGKDIPVNVTRFVEGGVPVLALVVGAKDAQGVESLLEKHEFGTLEMIMHKWKRKNPEVFAERMKEHQILVSNSRAFKIQSMDPKVMDNFTQSLLFNSQQLIVDVCPTYHSNKTGVLYVQYLKGHENALHQEILETLKDFPNPPDSCFTEPARITNPNSTEARTVQTRDTMGFKSQDATMIPPSKWAATLQQEYNNYQLPDATSKPAPVPAAITTKPKSFSAALMDGLLDDEVSEAASTLTKRTDNTGSQSSKKTAREIQLERKVETLRQELTKSQLDRQQMAQEMTQLKLTMSRQMDELRSMVSTLMAQQVPAKTGGMLALSQSPQRKRPNQQPTPSKTGWYRNMHSTVTGYDTIMADETPPVGIPPEPPNQDAPSDSTTAPAAGGKHD